MSDTGTFRTTVLIENPLRRGETKAMPETLVDSGAELTWAPRELLESLGIRVEKHLGFRTADGRIINRDVGYAIVHAGGTHTIDEVEPVPKGGERERYRSAGSSMLIAT